jgi:hypothetical protein
MSIQFKPSKGKEEYYDNAARGIRTIVQQGCFNTAKEYEKILAELILAELDVEFTKQGEP